MGHVENGIIPNSVVAITPSHDANDGVGGAEVVITNEEEEKKKRVPSVKVRLFKRLKSHNASSSQASKLEFDADDFDVPIQKVTKICHNFRDTACLTLSSDDATKASGVQSPDQQIRLGHPRHPSRRGEGGD